ncbi:hypothetical protein IWZ03DRAFT_371800 [Phyllosticta citriasiana]|uniref:Secreted protein n=1 Tax=Phyllosticta citriasiana TaxID=595635 RepID=A0ABR1KR01_9PEZI
MLIMLIGWGWGWVAAGAPMMLLLLLLWVLGVVVTVWAWLIRSHSGMRFSLSLSAVNDLGALVMSSPSSISVSSDVAESS